MTYVAGTEGKVSGPVFVHADAIVIGETGILIRGASGAGKSRLALALIFLAEASGYFSRLVGDDRICLEARGSRLVARGHPAIEGAIECRGRGILETPSLDAAVIGLVVDLRAADLPRFPGDGDLTVTLGGVTVPAMPVPIDLGPADQASRVLQYFRLRRKAP